ncbi:aminopyrimidine aminohydrolase [Neptunitalea chrysea]|uniref:Aminopyrimidine aminohydrolase n=1 Tax=Neptunitalea chrysea TaxID=1647581 RepID=A0A9W6EV12_9FLAO|nr:thiaminase II [Neptunitalea chrysea]GLB53254.1 aminopyrimidine aminohydrolase [Neptunitalea chrysea]
MTKWSEHAWETIQPIYNKIVEHPFITELKEGTLPEEKFAYYIQQDALYLANFGKVLSGIASKLSDAEHIQDFLGFSTGTIMVEKALHKTFIQSFSVNISTEKSPSCMLYTNYLQTQLAAHPLEVAIAAVLPCFWIYKEVGDYILATQTATNNKYQTWIDTYGGEEFANSVTKAIEISDYIALKTTKDIQKQMLDAFTTASKMEWLFWDSAYQLESWRI